MRPALTRPQCVPGCATSVRPPPITPERLAELSAIVARLVRVMQAAYVPVWIRGPVALLDDDTPLDVIAAGDAGRVSRVVAGLESPGAS